MSQIDQERLVELREIAKEVRKLVLKQVYAGQGGHVGGPLSATDILTVLYFHTMRIDPKNPSWEERDRFVLSKGHSTNALYAALALRGFFPVDELNTFDHINSRLQAHPDMTKTPGIDMSSGSLGQGLSNAIGMAMAARFLGKDFHTYAMIGDGESQEGQIWEAAFIASRYKVDNLTVFLDNNKIQQYGWLYPTAPEKLPPIDDPAGKFQSFGWNTLEIDGHDIPAIIDAIAQARAVKGKPTLIIANTIKGKGVSFMEGTYAWHTRVPTDEELEAALNELDRVG
jgi:transketolase